MKYYPIFHFLPLGRLLPLVGAVTLMSCTSLLEEDHSIPEPSEFYHFHLGSQVDATQIPCTPARDLLSTEEVSDFIKRELSNLVGNISSQELIQIGEVFHREHIPYPLTSHPKGAWVSEIIDQMKPFLVRREFPYHSYVVESSDFNAFTIPGGNIYVTTALLDAVSNKHELSYIIGHELGHNENNHTKELARLYKYVQESDSWWSYLVQYVSAIVGKADELECDFSGIYLLEKAGYDPELALGGVRLLEQFSKPKPDNLFEQLLADLTMTHPYSEDRRTCANSYVHASKVTIGCEQVFAEMQGHVVTKRSPLNIREYPIKSSEKLAKIPKGGMVRVLCDCVEQEFRKHRDWYLVEYLEKDSLVRGWVDKHYIQLMD